MTQKMCVCACMHEYGVETVPGGDPVPVMEPGACAKLRVREKEKGDYSCLLSVAADLCVRRERGCGRENKRGNERAEKCIHL